MSSHTLEDKLKKGQALWELLAPALLPTAVGAGAGLSTMGANQLVGANLDPFIPAGVAAGLAAGYRMGRGRIAGVNAAGTTAGADMPTQAGARA